MRVAITGHRGLPAETEHLVDEAIRTELTRRSDTELVGVSCLADGADTIFAHAVLDAGGVLEVVISAEQYRDGLPVEHHATYDELLAHATSVYRLKHVESDEEAHMAGSVAMLEQSEWLLAVWDGKPARGIGGTADVVELARSRGVPVTVVWPDGAGRD